MRVFFVYLVRFLLAGLGSAAVLRICYGAPTQYDRDLGNSYIVVCSILAFCALFSWILRPRRSRLTQSISSAAIALVSSLALIQLSERANVVDGMPWQNFYKDDYIAVFQLIAPVTIAVLTGFLSLIPERIDCPAQN
jgi:hypothetical protein